MVSFGEPRMGHTASLRLVPVTHAEVARTTPIVMWGNQITDAAVLIEAWSWSTPPPTWSSPWPKSSGPSHRPQSSTKTQ